MDDRGKVVISNEVKKEVTQGACCFACGSAYGLRPLPLFKFRGRPDADYIVRPDELLAACPVCAGVIHTFFAIQKQRKIGNRQAGRR